MKQNPLAITHVSERVLPKILRFIVYTLLITLFTASLPLLISYDHTVFFLENGPLEWGEFALLIASCTIFLTATKVAADFRELLMVLASLSGFAAIRELDGLLDEWRSLGGWKLGFALLLYAAYVIYTQRANFCRQLAAFLSTSSFALLWAGVIVALPVAQFIGHGPFLQALMGENYRWVFKHVIEECGEFVGYLMLLMGSIESYIQMKNYQAATKAGPS